MPIIFKTFFCFFLIFADSLPLFAAKDAEKAPAEPIDNKQTTTEQSSPEEKQYYIVEVILFRHLNEQGKQDEFWSKPDILNNSISDYSNNTIDNNQLTNDSPALAEYDMPNKRFRALRNGIAALSSENYKLSDSAAHLRYSKDYKLLAHFGWTQRSLSKNRALPIRITANQFSDSLIPDGDLKLYVSRYLHMQVDLKASECVYMTTPPLTEQTGDKALDEQLENGTSQLEKSKLEEGKAAELSANNTNPDEGVDVNQCVNQVYQFKQNRKMRSRELHYIDNPVFGLLVYVTPFTTSASDSE
ncbi:MAG: peptidoglycan binding protein CsiV [gamma proteobacterium symbiont of Lucinoma myriamae]|nr:peptidoglycan binding protein CsiV [gamma proteobacterium symbiont of Lucinoma myriamae]MCU7819955.1 peptidoglycan binding protein CsiV [gamma proteobacterium symbiont of Lucinoma myriamae]MCU7831661.1 peptidoglycan binding protein CsiV [gamma proteobacterium symbiont of Lucinoma myriamae]